MASNASLLNVKGEEDYHNLNSFFESHSYVDNYSVGFKDIKIYHQIKTVIKKDTYPHLFRWFHHISSLPEFILNQYDEEHNKKKGNSGTNTTTCTNKKSNKAAGGDDDDDNDIDLFGDDDNTKDSASNLLLEKKKQKEEELKKKKQKEKEKNRSILIIEIKPKSIDTDIAKIPKLVKQKNCR